jgi:S1-C subfamily serine protease
MRLLKILILLSFCTAMTHCARRISLPKKPADEAIIPSYLLHADCVERRGVDGETSRLFPGCADKWDDAFIRGITASTVHVTAGRHEDGHGAAYAAGTGVVIDKCGTVLTAFHVIKDAVVVTVAKKSISSDGTSVMKSREIFVDVTKVAEVHDVALLKPKFKIPNWKPLPIRTDISPIRGERLWHFGQKTAWAYGSVMTSSVSSVEINGLTAVEAFGDFGDSGGPFVTRKGELVGIMLSIKNDKSTSFFIPIDKALSALTYVPDPGCK